MPPPGSLGSQKGTGKKASGAKARSRNTTPMSSVPASANSSSIPAVEYLDSELLDIRYEYVRPIVYDDVIDQSASNAPNLPDSKALDALVTKLEKLRDIIDHRGVWCDKAMRLVASEKKGHVDELPLVAPTSGAGKAANEGEKKPNKKKRKVNDTLGPGDHNIGRLIIHTLSPSRFAMVLLLLHG
jgi:transcriptional adapter 3